MSLRSNAVGRRSQWRATRSLSPLSLITEAAVHSMREKVSSESDVVAHQSGGGPLANRISCSFTNSFGVTSGLSVALRPLMEKATISSVFSNGIRVLVHNARQYASHAAIEKVLQVKSEIIMKVYGTETVCGRSVQEMAVERRNCLFKHERKLRWLPWNWGDCILNDILYRFFDEYSDTNCDTDCLFTQILDTCGCLPYNFAISPNINVCNFSQIHCLMTNYGNSFDSTNDTPNEFRTPNFRSFSRGSRWISMRLSRRLWFHIDQCHYEQTELPSRQISCGELHRRPILVSLSVDESNQMWLYWVWVISAMAWMTKRLPSISTMRDKCSASRSATHWRISSTWQVLWGGHTLARTRLKWQNGV